MIYKEKLFILEKIKFRLYKPCTANVGCICLFLWDI